MKNIIIETNRLFLKELTEDDTLELLKLFSDPIAMQFFPAIKTEDEVNQWIKMNIESYIDNKFGLYLCVLKESSIAIGYCGLIFQKEVDGKDEVEIGYGLIRSYWHRGYATEAAIGCKNHGFEILKMEKLISLIRPENTPSINVAIRNGMSWQKDIMRWDYIHSIYAIDRSEYMKSLKS